MQTFSPCKEKTDSNEWYILSSIDKALVVTDENFHVKSITALDPKLFPQPEGINFDSKFNLYIISEAGDQDKGIIYKFEK
ncbi:SdiA-regulated domain-containing protein [Sphingobacterium sp. E70]|uniref:SdiA-regulated domain-containing protein n=1 Tax=Sphingobacterium sp. E70 TaxID=2853439 RepID=UPI00359C4276